MWGCAARGHVAGSSEPASACLVGPCLSDRTRALRVVRGRGGWRRVNRIASDGSEGVAGSSLLSCAASLR
jgi:hypothetical protein